MKINGGVKLGTTITIIVLLVGVIVGYVRTQETVKQNMKDIEQVKETVEGQCVKKDTIEGLKELTQTKFESQAQDIQELRSAVQRNHDLLIELIKQIKKNNKESRGS